MKKRLIAYGFFLTAGLIGAFASPASEKEVLPYIETVIQNISRKYISDTERIEAIQYAGECIHFNFLKEGLSALDYVNLEETKTADVDYDLLEEKAEKVIDMYGKDQKYHKSLLYLAQTIREERAKDTLAELLEGEDANSGISSTRMSLFMAFCYSIDKTHSLDKTIDELKKNFFFYPDDKSLIETFSSKDIVEALKKVDYAYIETYLDELKEYIENNSIDLESKVKNSAF